MSFMSRRFQKAEPCRDVEALARRSLGLITEAGPPVLRFPVLTHEEVLAILADKPEGGR